MRISIITGPCLATTHGTGAQILRFFGTSAVPFFHLYWDSNPFGRSEHPCSFLLENREWPWQRGRRSVARIRNRFGIGWWKQNNVDEQKLSRFLRSEDLRCDVAYVVVAREYEAQRANSILQTLNCPYVVHLMDLDHDDGLDPDTMPQYGQLLRGAASVLVLNGGLKTEAEKFGVSNLQMVTFGQEVVPLMTQGGVASQPIRLLVAGSVSMHQEGLGLLAQAWSLAPFRQKMEIIYMGADSGALPEALSEIVTNLGYVGNDEYQRILSTCQIAYLPGPTRLDTIGRFSVPSRLSDFLMNGLPVVACLATGSAAETMLSPLIPGAVRIAKTPEQIIQAIMDFTSSPSEWQRASQQARNFAVDHLSMPVVRDKVFEALHDAVHMAQHNDALSPLTKVS